MLDYYENEAAEFQIFTVVFFLTRKDSVVGFSYLIILMWHLHPGLWISVVVFHFCLFYDPYKIQIWRCHEYFITKTVFFLKLYTKRSHSKIWELMFVEHKRREKHKLNWVSALSLFHPINPNLYQRPWCELMASQFKICTCSCWYW